MMLSVTPKFTPARRAVDGTAPAGPRPERTPVGEFRSAPRLSAAGVPTVTAVRISPGGISATLVNISESGVLVECRERLRPGTVVELTFEGSLIQRIVEGRVVRNSVSSITTDGRIRYHVGISFTEAIRVGLGGSPSEPPAIADDGVNLPARAQNRW